MIADEEKRPRGIAGNVCRVCRSTNKQGSHEVAPPNSIQTIAIDYLMLSLPWQPHCRHRLYLVFRRARKASHP